MGFLGMDLIAIQHLSRQLDTQSEEVRAASNQLASIIESTAWIGADRDRFVREWQSDYGPALRRSAELLREASVHAAQGAAGQDKASRS